MDTTDLTARIRRIIIQHGRLLQKVDPLLEDTELFQAGMTSHACVNVMLALESEFDFEFPDRMLTRGMFSSIAAIREAITQIEYSTRMNAHYSSDRHALLSTEG
jgi:acyl carrier protein